MFEEFYGNFSFTPKGSEALLLTGFLLSSEDDLGARFASHEYLKRDGGELEPMGAAQSRFVFRIVLMGSAPLTQGGAELSAGDRYRTLVECQRKTPRGLLVHPRLGRIQAGFSKIKASETPAKAVDQIELTLEFIEDQLDQALSFEQNPTPQGRANQVATAYSYVLAATTALFGDRNPGIPLYREAIQNVTLASERLAQVAATFTESALISAQSTLPDLALRGQLGTVRDAMDGLLDVLPPTLPFTREPDVSLTPIRHGAYMTYSTCIALYESVLAQKPEIIPYVVPVAMPLDRVLLGIYGNDAASHFDEILTLNRIPDAMWVSAGTRLQIVSPQPIQ